MIYTKEIRFDTKENRAEVIDPKVSSELGPGQVQVHFESAVVSAEGSKELKDKWGMAEEFQGIPVKTYSPSTPPPPGKKFPVVYFIQGGPGLHTGDYGKGDRPGRHDFFVKLAAQGYVVVVPSMQGSEKKIEDFILNPTTEEIERWNKNLPAMRNSSFDYGEPLHAHELVDVVTDYKRSPTIDPEKSYSLMHSLGGQWGGQAMALKPDLFSKAIFLATGTNVGAFFFGWDSNYLSRVQDEDQISFVSKVRVFGKGMVEREMSNQILINQALSYISYPVNMNQQVCRVPRSLEDQYHAYMNGGSCPSVLDNPILSADANQRCSVVANSQLLPQIPYLVIHAIDDIQGKMEQSIHLYSKLQERAPEDFCTGLFFSPQETYLTGELPQNTHGLCINGLNNEMHRIFFPRLMEFFQRGKTGEGLTFGGRPIELKELLQIARNTNGANEDYTDLLEKFQAGQPVSFSPFSNATGARGPEQTFHRKEFLQRYRRGVAKYQNELKRREGTITEEERKDYGMILELMNLQLKKIDADLEALAGPE